MGLKELLEIELARAESIVNESQKGKRRRHEPTIENHRGQVIALRKALSWIAADSVYVRTPIEVKSNLTISWAWIFWTLGIGVLIIAIT